jgi:hypothetical protein
MVLIDIAVGFLPEGHAVFCRTIYPELVEGCRPAKICYAAECVSIQLSPRPPRLSELGIILSSK